MRKLVKIMFLLSIVLPFAACNTVQGAGKDIEKAGEKIEEAAD